MPQKLWYVVTPPVELHSKLYYLIWKFVWCRLGQLIFIYSVNGIESVICRAMLTAIHQNHNANRKQKFNADGTEHISIQKKKSTNLTSTAYCTKEKADYVNFYVIAKELPNVHGPNQKTWHTNQMGVKSSKSIFKRMHLKAIRFKGEQSKYAKKTISDKEVKSKFW